mgnify:FL=1
MPYGPPVMQKSGLPESNAFKAYRIFTAPDDGYYKILDISYEGGDSNEYFTVGLFPPTTNKDGDGPTTINGGVYWAMFGKVQGNIFNSSQKQGSMYQGYNSQLNYGGLGFMRIIPPGWSLWIWAIDGATTSEVVTNTLACMCEPLIKPGAY